ncbi:MAG: DUF58 domain-containing protein [Rhodothermales bacterium]
MQPAATRFIKPDVLTRIANLELLARGVVEGFITGLHRSPYKGVSVEFMEYRPYMPGDDPAYVDWKLFARTDRYYIKQFEDETNTSLNLLMDVSPSMGYGSGAVTKLDYASYLTAALAYLVIRQRDAVGLSLFDSELGLRIPPRSTTGHLHTLLTHLEAAKLGTRTAIGKPLHDLAKALKRRGFVVLVSDLLDDPEVTLDGLRHFRFKGHEVIVFHLLDPQEVRFDFDDVVELEDLETGEKLLVEPDDARALYLENLERFQGTLRRGCALLGIEYFPLVTDEPLDFALFEYLAARQKRR